ncbi:transglutaminase domain-containing protein [Rhodococcus sp. NPDC127528]|uniref:transglutaminase domain-containing protein n=1 Tax=unclassified Rhodococcus (in: high G+C Gram-positive bacteria) TaxID=192944 RepID=UPI003645F074
MTCTLVTTWRGRELEPTTGESAGGIDATTILDWGRFGPVTPATDDFLRSTHRWVQQHIRAVYALDDTQPASVTLAHGRGSCSQRLAVVEALARRAGIATRVEGLVLRGEFWYPRFRYLRPFVPDRVLLAWPSFRVDGQWLDASAAFSGQGCTTSEPFTNSGAETLFDAAGRSPISWSAATQSAACLDLSGHVVQSLGSFDSRDGLFARYGQTLARPVRTVLEPFSSRWSAG